MSNAGGDNARKLATNLIGQWVKRYAGYSEPVWLPHVMARRLASIFSHGRLVILNSEMMWRSQPVRLAARTVQTAGADFARGAGRCAAVRSRRGAGAVGRCAWTTASSGCETGLQRLEDEIERQILPDGGHVSRSPEALLTAYRHVVMVLEALSGGGRGTAARSAQRP